MTSKKMTPIALVTGASRGIGRAISVALATKKYQVALVGRDADTLKETKALCSKAGGDAHEFVADLADLEALPSLVSAVVERFGALNVLINNAGVGGSGKVHEVDLERWDRCMQTNIMSVMHLTHAAAPHVKATPGGSIITIASVAARMTYSGGAAYAASKHAVLGFSGCIFEDLREFGVKVAAICPGFVDTEMVTGNLDRAKMIGPEDVAEAVTYILDSSTRVCPTEIVLRPQYSPYR